MRADAWIVNDLAEKLIADWYNGYIFTEFDLQVAAYHALRKHFDRERSEDWIIRAQPMLRAPQHGLKKPDIVLYKKGIPTDFIELKCLLDGIDRGIEGIEADLEKLKILKPVWNVHHAYVFVLFDGERALTLKESTREPWMKHYLTVVSANVRLHADGRKRRGYQDARDIWEDERAHSTRPSLPKRG